MSLAVFPLLLVVATVWWSVRSTGNPLNGYVIANMLHLATVYLIPTIAPLLLDIELPVLPIAWVFASIAQVAQFCGYLRGLRAGQRIPAVTQTEIPMQRLRTVAIVCLILYATLFYQIIRPIGIAAAFANPRAAVYESTRTGFGHLYFVAGSFLTLFCLLGVFAFRRKWLVVLIGSAASLPFGNKTRFLILANVLMVYFCFFHPAKKYIRRPAAVLTIVILLLVLILAAFWYTTYDLELGGVLEMVLGFGAEYQTNFSLLATEFASYFPTGFFYGRIFLEDNLLAFAPRVIWANKPLHFGSLHLSYVVFPAQTELNHGAPSFGPFGQPFADFGLFGVVQVILQQALMGYLIGRFESSVRPGDIRSFLCLFTVIAGGFVVVGGAINPAVMALVNLLIIPLLMRVLRYEGHHQLTPMPS